MADIEIGIARSARQAYGLDEIGIMPSRRTRHRDDVDLSWSLDGYPFDLPLMAAPMDSVCSPDSIAEIDRLGGLGVLNLEGLWTRHEDPVPLLQEIAELADEAVAARLRELYHTPVQPELIAARVRQLKDAGVIAAGALSPPRVEQHHRVALDAGLDVLVIQGTVVSAEHVSSQREPLNLKDFIARYDLPVVVGGCASHATALHLMATGAAGVLVGHGSAAATDDVLGIDVPMATAIADVAAARSRHLEESGRYVQVIAHGGLWTSGHIAKAIACGADAVMLGRPLARATEAPAAGAHWGLSAGHERLPRSRKVEVSTGSSLEQIIRGPATGADGTTNLFGALATTMAMCGYESVKAFQRADLVVSAGR